MWARASHVAAGGAFVPALPITFLPTTSVHQVILGVGIADWTHCIPAPMAELALLGLPQNRFNAFRSSLASALASALLYEPSVVATTFLSRKSNV